MSNSVQQAYCRQWRIAVAALFFVLLIGGRGNIFAQTDTEHEAEKTLRDLKIDITPDPNHDVPEIYKAPPKIIKQTVGGTEEFKLFYYLT